MGNYYCFGICNPDKDGSGGFHFYRIAETIADEFTSEMFLMMMKVFDGMNLGENYIAILMVNTIWNSIEMGMKFEGRGEPNIDYNSENSPKIILKIEKDDPQITFKAYNGWDKQFSKIVKQVGLITDSTIV